MPYNNHSNLKGTHAVFGASNYHWLNYSPDKIVDRYYNSYSTQIGTLLHELAQKHISYKMKITKSEKKHLLFYLLDHGIPSNVIDIDYFFENFMSYVNDAIGFRLEPEVILYYSDYFYGTTDGITPLDTVRKTNQLRIHDYKSGTTPAHVEQLLIYNALFCLEYGFKPEDLNTELRIYQSNQIFVHQPTPEEVVSVMNKIIDYNKRLDFVMEGNNNGTKR